MNPRLRQLLVVAGLISALGAGGSLVSYLSLQPDVGVTNAELVDAGILNLPRAQLRCRVRVNEECRDLPDGGLRPRYLTMRGEVAVVNRAEGLDGLISRWVPKPGGGDCIERLGCELLESGGCTDGTFCDGQLGGRAEVNRGACRRTDAGLCRVRQEDGGLRQAPIGNVLQPGTFVGAGCFPAYEGPELAGQQGQSFPEECPLE